MAAQLGDKSSRETIPMLILYLPQVPSRLKRASARELIGSWPFHFLSPVKRVTVVFLEAFFLQPTDFASLLFLSVLIAHC
jgi:hypothetical protein